MGPVRVMYTNMTHDTQDMSRWTVPIMACPVCNAIKQLYGLKNITLFTHRYTPVPRKPAHVIIWGK